MDILLYFKSKGRAIIKIRRAKPYEAELLSELAFDSKSHWNYKADYLEAAREHLKITDREIEDEQVFVYEVAGNIKGYYHFRTNDEPELVWLFVKPDSIGTGIGKLLWNHLLSTLKHTEIISFVIKSDPNAEQFYLRLGAHRIGLKDSTVDSEMKLPVLKYVIV
ncbi:GNAT family N-acetyltransferase [Paenibacillus sp. GSMTC-2017]|uniref:GNAT family N-acetyltransferase n=1 Tax=Paenibacillus sp. GSMTC-2017 TaxID=2794350 RepID=UPI0018D9287E|nr:GNAT family N-acetyltransferase [Paenibacillus sp. GSMTC-2017]